MEYLNKNENNIVVKARMRIRGINNPLRQRILAFIKSNNNRISVTEVYKKLRLEQSVTSAQLGILRKEKLVTTKREGKKIFYSVDDAAIKHLVKACEEILA